ncbi:hypothetical protein CARUB_v10018745mg [Capsella rubella]|uniref:Uncharacterized protein n=1 Tax=Capsella rubella TaxID=81985 RepID=R0HNC5_9BRAS|nr:hypothetical protein CARUB_v10018745mg [Capsella rubella]
MNPPEEAKGDKTDKDDVTIDVVVEELRGGSDPKLLKKSAGREKCCIFKIPERLEENNKKAYEPRVVSFGPYHNGKPHLQMIQEHKHRFLGFFMAEAKKNGVDAKDLIEAVSKLEEDIRESYSESLYDNGDMLGRKKLIEMMVLDGCFILMLFLAVAGIVRYHEIENDPIFVMPWIIPAIRSDLLLLENQVPYFLLQTLFEKSKIEPSSGINTFTFNFFDYSFLKPKEFWLKHHNLEANHLLDLIRKIFMPDIPKEEKESKHFLDLIRKFCIPGEEIKELDAMLKKGKQDLHSMLEQGKQEVDLMLKKGKQELDSILNEGKHESMSEKEKQELDYMLEERKQKSDSQLEEEDPPGRPHLRMILSARKLQLKGIKFKPRKNAETVLDIRRRRKYLEIPPLILDDFLISVFLNCVAYEQFYVYCNKHITSYVALMGCLLKSEADAMFLTEVGILENYFGSGDDVSRFFKVVGKDINFDISESYLADVFEGVNKYTSRGWHVQWAGFKHTHFDSPWTALSSCAALTLVILTIIQAFFAMFGYFHPPK